MTQRYVRCLYQVYCTIPYQNPTKSRDRGGKWILFLFFCSFLSPLGASWTRIMGQTRRVLTPATPSRMVKWCRRGTFNTQNYSACPVGVPRNHSRTESNNLCVGLITYTYIVSNRCNLKIYVPSPLRPWPTNCSKKKANHLPVLTGQDRTQYGTVDSRQ